MPKTVSILEVTPSKYKNFSCGKRDLDEYLKRFAKTNHKKGIGKTFVLERDDEVIGYYTVSMGSVEFASIPQHFRDGLPRYPLPVARIGRLAVSESWHGKGIGKTILVDALIRILDAATSVAAYAIVVDAKDVEAKAFYEHYGFIAYAGEEFSLFLPMATVQSLIA